jgi:hypothetical protein
MASAHTEAHCVIWRLRHADPSDHAATATAPPIIDPDSASLHARAQRQGEHHSDLEYVTGQCRLEFWPGFLNHVGMLVAPLLPSYEQLAALVAEQGAVNEKLRTRVVELEAEVRELRTQLKLNSRNSSKPPSTDSPFTTPKSSHRKSGRKPGGQAKHHGSTLRLVADPDRTLIHEPGPCTGCGTELSGTPATGVVRRQVVDLPEIIATVTEHRVLARRCVCGTATRADAPIGVNAPIRHGPRSTAAALFHTGQFLSKARTAEAMARMFGLPISPSTVATMAARAADDLAGFLDAVADAPVAGFDETGFRVDNRSQWAHCARTDLYTSPPAPNTA